jgi:hypothetical protein
MIVALKNKGIYDATRFIVSAKHGQSPINPVKVNQPGSRPRFRPRMVSAPARSHAPPGAGRVFTRG